MESANPWRAGPLCSADYDPLLPDNAPCRRRSAVMSLAGLRLCEAAPPGGARPPWAPAQVGLPDTFRLTAFSELKG